MDWSSPHLRTDSDHLWFNEGLLNGYRLRPVPTRFWRMPLIRHIRAFRMLWRAEALNRRYDKLGIKMRADYEGWLSHAIWKGWQ